VSSSHLNWAEPPDAIVVMGKRPGRDGAPRELQARAALAVLCWRRATRKPWLACLEGHDLPGSRLAGADVVRDMALAAGVPAGQIVAPALTNCTARELRELARLLKERQANRAWAITHPYHARRTQWYFRAAKLPVTVVACTRQTAAQLAGTEADASLLRWIDAGEVRGLPLLRERLVETTLSALHALNPAGQVECWLADRVRGTETA